METNPQDPNIILNTQTTLRCDVCGKEFTKPTAFAADSALRMHRLRTHEKRIVPPNQRDQPVRPPKKPAPSIGEVGGFTRRHWSHEEWERLHRAMAQVVSSDPHVRLLEAIHRAEGIALSEDRRKLRRFLTAYGSPSLNKLRLYYDNAKSLAPRSQQQANNQPPEIEPDAESISQHLPASQSISEHQPPHEHDVAASISPWVLVGELAKTFFKDLVERFDRIESALLARIGPPPPAQPVAQTHSFSAPVRAIAPLVAPEPPKPKPEEKRIAVIGVQRDQFENARQRVEHLPFRLIWMDWQQKNTSFPRSCDLVILSRVGSHQWYHRALNEVGRERIIMVDGGIASLVQRIMDYHARLVAEAGRKTQ